MYPEQLLPRITKCLSPFDKKSEFIRLLTLNPKTFFFENNKYTMDILEEICIPSYKPFELYTLSLFFNDNLDSAWLKYFPKDKERFCSVWDNKTEYKSSEIDAEEKSVYPIYLFSSKLAVENFDTVLGKVNMNYKHSPTMCNFYHFELYVEDSETKKRIPRKAGSNREKTARKLLDDILYLAINHAK